MDLAVGAPYDDDGGWLSISELFIYLGIQRGAVWILMMNRNGTVKYSTKISATQGNFAGDLNDNDYFGHSVSWISDLDGDGVSDLAVWCSV